MMPKLKKHLDKHGIDVGLYTLKWFFQCFLDRVPFELALRLWDIFLMDGDKVLICGAYTILKIHQKQLLAKKSMDDLLDYIQSKIPSDLNLDNDKAIETYQKCMEDLHRKKLDTAGEPTEEELPKKPFGLIENIIKPVPVRKEPAKIIISKEIVTKQDDKSQTISSEGGESKADDDEEFDDNSEKAQSRVSAPVTSSSSVANSPNNISRPLSSVSNFSYASAISIPGGETVRIHVPYSNSSTHQHDISISNAPPKSTAGVSRMNFDVLKNDPNRIKIDISSK